MAALEYFSIAALQYWNGGTLLRVRKFEPSVTNLRLARLNRKRPGVKRPSIVRHQPPVSRNLEQQGLTAHERPGAVGHIIDQVHTAGLVDGHLPVDQTGKRDGNRSATGALHDHVNEILREGIECNAPRIQAAIFALIPTATLAGDVPQRRQPI